MSFYLVDLPGYGYARGGAEAAREFEELTRQYFDPRVDARRRLAGVLQLIDSRHADLPQDAAAHQWLLTTQVPLAIVATKIDKLSGSEKPRTLRSLKARYDSPVCPESAPDGVGLDEIWKMVRRWVRGTSAGKGLGT